MAFLNFNAAEVAPETEYKPLPAGEYVAMIVESSLENTKAGTGQYLKMKFQIVDGEHKGRAIFDNLNINNPNQKAIEIARGRLSAICHAVNRLQIQASEELHNLPLKIKVGLEPNMNNDGFNNIIKAVMPLNAMPQQSPAMTQPAAPVMQQPAPQPAASSIPPWMA